MSLAVQPLVLQLGRALLAFYLVLLAMDLLTVHAAVLDETTGIAVLELHCVAGFLAAVGAAAFACATHFGWWRWSEREEQADLGRNVHAVLRRLPCTLS